MSVKNYCIKLFPEVKFTGGSMIHASRADELGLTKHDASVKYLMLKIINKNIGNNLYDYLVNLFEPAEFFISRDDFTALLITDVYRLLSDDAASTSRKMLRNPVTKHIFHRIALHKDLVGGVRFWIRYDVVMGWVLGYRFRLELITPEATLNIRQASTTECMLAVTETEQLKTFLDIPEPYEEPVSERIKVRNTPY